MKRAAFFILILISFAGFCFGADPVEGFWVSYDEKLGYPTAGWEIYTVNDKLFGKILSILLYPQDVKAEKCKDSYRDFPLSGKVSEMPVVGTPWIYNLTRDKHGVWSGGRIIDPETGNMYKCKITFRSASENKYNVDMLIMRGEIGLGMGRNQYWFRATKEQASSLR